MVDTAFITPVANAAVFRDGFQDDLLFGLTDSDHQQNFVLFFNSKMPPEGLAVYGGDHTTAQSFLPGPQKYGLAGNSVVATGIVADICIIQNHNIGRGLLAFRGAEGDLGIQVLKRVFSGDRDRIREESVRVSLEILRRHLLEESPLVSE